MNRRAGKLFDISEVYLKVFDNLKRIIGSSGIKPSEAEDVLQDVFIQAVQKFKYDRNEDEAARWLIRVTVNRCNLEHRKKKSFCRATAQIFQNLISKNELTAEDSGQPAMLQEEVEVLQSSMKEMDGSLLYPLIMKYFCNFNSDDIGKHLELNPATVRTRLRNARLFLAKRLLEQGVEP